MAEKSNNKIYIFFDTLTKLAIINVLTIITSLGIITLFPSLTAAVKTIKDIDEATDRTNLYKTYFLNFKNYFKRSFFVGLIVTTIIAAFAYALIYYQVILGSEDAIDTNWALMANIGFYFSSFILLVIFIIVNQLTMTITYFNFRFKDNFKFAFLMSFRNLKNVFILMFTWFASFLLIMYLTGVWFFFGIAVPLYVLYILYKPTYVFLTKNKEVVDLHEEGE